MKRFFRQQLILGCSALVAFTSLGVIFNPRPARANSAAAFGLGVGLGALGGALGASAASRPRNTVIVVPQQQPTVVTSPVVYPYPTPVAPVAPVPVYPAGAPIYNVMASHGLVPSACMPGTVMIQVPYQAPVCAYPTAYYPAGSYYYNPQFMRITPVGYF